MVLWAMKRVLRSGLIFMMMLVASGTLLHSTEAAACTSSWSKSGYKSYSQIRDEVRQQLGEANIVRVELCGSGATAFFNVVALADKGGHSVRVTLRVNAN
jgi:hypothetical protein